MRQNFGVSWGQCIDKVFYLDGELDCLDLSDEFKKQSYYMGCDANSDLTCEERTCPPTSFSCGNGKCYDGPNIYSRDHCRSPEIRSISTDAAIHIYIIHTCVINL